MWVYYLVASRPCVSKSFIITHTHVIDRQMTLNAQRYYTKINVNNQRNASAVTSCACISDASFFLFF